MNNNNFLTTIRMRIYKENSLVFGSGIAELLRLTNELHSLHAAAKKMGMTYKKALFIVKRAEEGLGQALVQKSIGGTGGGGSYLTAFGTEINEKFCEIEAEVLNFACAKINEKIGF